MKTRKSAGDRVQQVLTIASLGLGVAGTMGLVNKVGAMTTTDILSKVAAYAIPFAVFLVWFRLNRLADSVGASTGQKFEELAASFEESTKKRLDELDSAVAEFKSIGMKAYEQQLDKARTALQAEAEQEKARIVEELLRRLEKRDAR